MIDFEYNDCNSIKSLAIKKNTNVKVTSRFIKCLQNYQSNHLFMI